MMEEENDNIEKVVPYKRLKAILSEGSEPELTDQASKNIDDLLGIKDNPTNFWEKIKNFFSKIDSKIFSKPEKISNRYQKRK